MQRLAVRVLLLASRYVLAAATDEMPAAAATVAGPRRPAVRSLRDPLTRPRRLPATYRGFAAVGA